MGGSGSGKWHRWNKKVVVEDPFRTVKKTRPHGWRGNQPKENTIKAAILPLLGNDVAEVERIFLIIKAQLEY